MKKDQPIPDPHEVVRLTLEELEISVGHSDACMAETRYWLENTGLDDNALENWTELPFVTIDNPDSRDLDQALLIERESTGYRVRYALSDASYYIKPGSQLFADALLRGATYYTPGFAAPMLPVELSEGLISLNPGVDRRALVFDMNVNSDGFTTQTSIVRAKIRSQAKLNYAGVQAWLNSQNECTNAYEPSLLLLKELGETLIRAAELRGVVKFDRTETSLKIDGTPPSFQTGIRGRYDTERYNEQISLMCNMQGAQLLMVLNGSSDVLQAIYRVHDAPLKKNLHALRETLELFAKQQKEPALWEWKKDQSLADFLEQLPSNEQAAPKVKAIQRQIMQAQTGSSYEPEPSEHHALKAASYARFSSPMREIVGIFTHKELLEALSGRKPGNQDDDEALRTQVIASATASRQKQRKLSKKIKLAALHQNFSQELLQQSRTTYTGIIVGLRQDRLYISLDQNALDIKVYKDNLDSNFATDYRFSSAIALPDSVDKPSWQLGDSVSINVQRFDKERSRYYFTISQ